MSASRIDVPVALEASGLAKSYGDRRALRDVSFSAVPGELLAVIGPNGAGKTTLLQILAGALSPSAGSVSLDPRDVGWVPQQPAVYSKLSVRENLRLFARLEKVGDVEATVDRMLAQADLADRGDDQVARLSGGNQQRVNIAVGVLGGAGRAAARRAVVVARPAPARAAVGVRLRARAAAGRRSCTRPTTSPRRSATRTGCSCWPTASCCSPGRRTSSSARCRRMTRTTSRERSSRFLQERGH